MRQIQHLFLDERLSGFCAYCDDGVPTTRDHVPPRVFLDKPYPDNLPVVGSCPTCNIVASIDEEYVACLLEAAVCNTVEPSSMERSTVARIFQKRPALAKRVSTRLTPAGLTLKRDDADRVTRVITKTARALWTFETGDYCEPEPLRIQWDALQNLNQIEIEEILTSSPNGLVPEIGSRQFIRTFQYGDHGWQEVQADRFTYKVEPAGQVKMVFRDYLVALVEIPLGV